MPTGFTPLTGTATAIRATADAWGVRYAREETETGEGDYSMSHTADVFLVDGAGMRRATFPFGTSSEAMTAVLRTLAADGTLEPADRRGHRRPSRYRRPQRRPPSRRAPPDSASRSASSSRLGTEPGPGHPDPVGRRRPHRRPGAAPQRPARSTAGGQRSGPPVAAIPVQPPGVDRVSYVATMTIPSPGPWRLEVTGAGRVGSAPVTASTRARRPRSGRRPDRPDADAGRCRRRRPGDHDGPGARTSACRRPRPPTRSRPIGRSCSSSTRRGSASRRPAAGRSSWRATCSTGGRTSPSSTSSRIATRSSPTRRSSTARSTRRP